MRNVEQVSCVIVVAPRSSNIFSWETVEVQLAKALHEAHSDLCDADPAASSSCGEQHQRLHSC